jgi:hypothetical protein
MSPDTTAVALIFVNAAAAASVKDTSPPAVVLSTPAVRHLRGAIAGGSAR